ncbi:EPOR protein, partial [Bucco capensis]|nr:EPOR protein [Bucco capensis]
SGGLGCPLIPPPLSPQVGVPAGRREQRVGSLRGHSLYSARVRARPDGVSFGGFWSSWSQPARATTASGEG